MGEFRMYLEGTCRFTAHALVMLANTERSLTNGSGLSHAPRQQLVQDMIDTCAYKTCAYNTIIAKKVTKTERSCQSTGRKYKKFQTVRHQNRSLCTQKQPCPSHTTDPVYESHLRGAVEPALDVGVHGAVFKAGGAKVNDLDLPSLALE